LLRLMMSRRGEHRKGLLHEFLRACPATNEASPIEYRVQRVGAQSVGRRSVHPNDRIENRTAGDYVASMARRTSCPSIPPANVNFRDAARSGGARVMPVSEPFTEDMELGFQVHLVTGRRPVVDREPGHASRKPQEGTASAPRPCQLLQSWRCRPRPSQSHQSRLLTGSKGEFPHDVAANPWGRSGMCWAARRRRRTA
jgi:hypothetical protein